MPYLVQGAALAPTTTGVFSSGQLRRLLIALVAVALAFTLIAIEAPIAAQAHTVSASSSGRAAERIVSYAKSHIGARFRMGATGMRYFDCSGLVYRVYQQAGVLSKIGGSRKRAASYYKWFRERGLVSRSNPRTGDLVWYTEGGRIVHMGLYIGNNQVVSALVNPYGVRRTSVGGIRVKFLAFGHARLDT